MARADTRLRCNGPSSTSVGGTGAWTQPGQNHATQGSDDKYKGCTVQGDKAYCAAYSGTYDDPDKTIDYTGTADFVLAGDKLTVTTNIVTASTPPKWKHGDKEYKRAVRPGASFTVNYSRK